MIDISVKKLWIKSMIIMGVFTIVIIIEAIIGLLVFAEDGSDPTFTNILFLIIEIGMDVIITAIVYYQTRKSEEKMKNTLDNINEIEIKQQKFIRKIELEQTKRAEYAIEEFEKYLKVIKGFLTSLNQIPYDLESEENKKDKILRRTEYIIELKIIIFKISDRFHLDTEIDLKREL